VREVVSFRVLKNSIYWNNEQLMTKTSVSCHSLLNPLHMLLPNNPTPPVVTQYIHPLLYSSAMQCCPFDNNIHQCLPLLYNTAHSSSPTPLSISFHSSIRPSSGFSILYCFNSDASAIGPQIAFDLGDPRIDLILSLLVSETGDEVLLVECQGPNLIHVFLRSVIEGSDL
jgi:hypothetical protein